MSEEKWEEELSNDRVIFHITSAHLKPDVRQDLFRAIKAFIKKEKEKSKQQAKEEVLDEAIGEEKPYNPLINHNSKSETGYNQKRSEIIKLRNTL